MLFIDCHIASLIQVIYLTLSSSAKTEQ